MISTRNEKNYKALEPAKSSTDLAQTDIVNRLRDINVPEAQYVGLRSCTALRCGMGRCREVCRHGSRRRRRKQARAVYRLLKQSGGLLFGVRIGHGAWSRPRNQLANVSLAAVKQFNRRALNLLHTPDIVAVGMLKVSFAPEERDARWKPIIHQIVGGADRDEIETAFTTRLDKSRHNYVLIDPITDLKAAIKRALSVETVGRLQNDGFELTRPKADVRGEYYRWVLGFGCGGRLIRYGCDRHFNKLVKKGRTIRPKVRKPRPNPTWLAPWQFGSETRELRERTDAIERMHQRR